jgi:hypothetical protein
LPHRRAVDAAEQSPREASASTSALQGGPASNRIRGVLGSRRLWQVTTALAAGLLGALVALAGPGSIQTIQHAYTNAASSAARAPHWAQPCFHEGLPFEHPRLDFCARVSGRVVYSDVDPASHEAHLLVLASFHMIVVELPARAQIPGWAAHITAVGPLLRARNGQREVQALWVRG